ncbi:hypothetical protein AAF712_007095 [Marasmius tenuissimus]|uniref:Uncharacterized protein n=1 Tax=Marasmius tenuissimus TaxID=585030 RepID=A0ABR3A087_9AGAR
MCIHLGSAVEKVKQRAGGTGARLTSSECSHSQLVARVEKRDERLVKKNLQVSSFHLDLRAHKLTKIQVLNSSRDLKRTRMRVDDLMELKTFIEQNSVPNITLLLAQCAKEGISVKKTLERMSMAVRGEYHTRKYTQYQIDLGTLCYLTGGSSLSYALHNSNLSLPSLSTIKENNIELALTVSVALKDIGGDIVSNIEVLFNPKSWGQGPRTKRVGHGLSLDEIALEERPFYLALMDKIGGLCREHSKSLNLLVGNTLDNVLAAAEAVFGDNPFAHLAKEATVAAISSMTREAYYAKPILISPTCKTVCIDDSVHIIREILRAWKESPYGDAMHGPIWFVASDGDSKRRGALYVICMTHRLSEENPLYDILLPLTGLNKWTSKDGVTMDFDFKHLFKRICTLLCSKEGMLVNATVINKLLLSEWLLRISTLSHGWIHNLLNPKDAQNVPRAIDLMKVIEQLKSVPSRNPSEDSTSIALRLFGEVLHSLIQPFINPDLSLTEQVQHLLTTSLLLFAIFDDHGTAFMSNQLYGDLQAMVKNAMFLVARTQVLDPSQEVFFTLLGDDVLETLFGIIRMLGGHSPNCDGKELADRLSRAMNLRDIYERNPELEKKAPRLSMTRSRDADHLRPRNWKGNVTAADCDLAKCYKHAISNATGILVRYGITKEFEKLFLIKGVDLMRPPCSKGSYPGLAKDHDRSMDSETSEEATGSSQGAHTSHTEADPSTQPCGDDSLPFVPSPEANNTAHQADIPVSPNTASVPQPTDPLETIPQLPLSMDQQQLESMTIVRELIQEEEASEAGNGAQSLRKRSEHSVWVTVEGEPCHKWTVIRVVFSEKDGYDRKKSTDRILRVRCYSIGGEKWEIHVEGSRLPEHDKFTFGNLFVTLLHIVGGGVALAVLQATTMRNHDVSVPTLSQKEMVLPKSNCVVSGQVLSLISLTDADLAIENDVPLAHWVWDGEYVAFNPSTKTTAGAPETLNQKALVVSVPGFMVVPLVEETIQRPCIMFLLITSRKQAETTWEIPRDLGFSALKLWESARRSKFLSKIPTVGRVVQGNFPYLGKGSVQL